MNSTNEEQSLLACVQENLADLAPQLIYKETSWDKNRLKKTLASKQVSHSSDWLKEHDIIFENIISL
jgi:hypothetical protein